jgi:hypothetical protein
MYLGPTILEIDLLVTWCILSPDLHFCVTGCGGVESTQHLFLHAARLVFSGLWFGLGLVSQKPMPTVLLITFFSSPTQQVASVRGGPSCNLSVLFAFGSCGMKEISESSEIRLAPWTSSWTKSSCSHTDGLGWQMLL